jgi:hypothetical protein
MINWRPLAEPIFTFLTQVFLSAAETAGRD